MHLSKEQIKRILFWGRGTVVVRVGWLWWWWLFLFCLLFLNSNYYQSIKHSSF